MQVSSHPFLAAGLTVLRLVSTSPLPSTQLPSRQLVDCNDLSATPDPSCWAGLDVSNYLTTNWTKAGTTCTDQTDDATCCGANELWANCFIRLAMGPPDGLGTSSSVGNIHCDTIGTAACPTDFTIKVMNYPAQARYVVIAIQSVNALFSNWFNALAPGTIQALLNDQSLITQLDPPKQTSFILGDLLTALTASLSFIGAPEIGAALSVVAKDVLNAVQQAPGIAKVIWPSGTEDSTHVQLGNLDQGLSKIDANLTAAITSSISTVMSDVPSFSEFASTGVFTGAAYLSLPIATEIFGLAFRTYVLSTAMTKNKWHAAPQCDMTRADVQSSVSGISTTGCTFDSNNICSDSDHIINAWYSDTTACVYTLAVNGAGPSPRDLMTEIVSNSWSTLEQLFDGALNCTIAGHAGQGVSPAIIGYGTDLSCMSQLAMCACDIECPVAKVNGKCPIPCCSG